MVMYANEVETKEKEKINYNLYKECNCVTVQFSQTGYYVQGSYLQVCTFS